MPSRLCRSLIWGGLGRGVSLSLGAVHERLLLLQLLLGFLFACDARPRVCDPGRGGVGYYTL